MEAVRKGDGADGQRAKVMGNFITDGEVNKIVYKLYPPVLYIHKCLYTNMQQLLGRQSLINLQSLVVGAGVSLGHKGVASARFLCQ